KAGPPGFGPPGGLSQPPPGVRPGAGPRGPDGGQPPAQGGRPGVGGQPPEARQPARGGRNSGVGDRPPPDQFPQGGGPGRDPRQGVGDRPTPGQIPQGGGPGRDPRQIGEAGMRMPNKDLRLMGRFYYFLWSLERAAVAYSLDRIGGKDWYTWGADFLVADQEKDGSWQGVHGSYGADTCFALLFLRRADLAKDLSASLRGKVKDTVELRGGGVGFKRGDSIKPIRSPFEDGIGPDSASAKPTTRPATRSTKPPPATANAEPEVAKLSAELVDAPASKWSQVLTKRREGKGTQYT